MSKKVNRLLEGLNEGQREGVLHDKGACCVIACGGAGKTKLATHRIAYLIEQGVNPNEILMFTFTKKASIEMKERVEELIGDKSNQITIGTFHSIYYSILKDYNARKTRGRKLDIAPDWWKIKTLEEIKKQLSHYNIEANEKNLASMIATQKNNMISCNDKLKLSQDVKFLEPVYREVYKLYENKKETEGKIDFEDMLFKVYQAFKKDDGFLQLYRNKFKYISLDEMQDINPLQNALLELMVNDEQNIFAVGDLRQSIYGFMGADCGIIYDFKDKWNAKLIELNINYRCSKEIVEHSNNLISHNSKILGGDAIANKSSNQKPIYFTSPSEFEQSEAIAKEIKQILSEGKYTEEDITILYRTNAESQPFEDTFMKEGIKHIVIGGLSFYNRREIKDLISYIQLAKNPCNDQAMLEIINRPNRFLGKVFIEKLTTFAKLKSLSLYKAIKQAPMCKEWRYAKGTSALVQIIDSLSDKYNNGANVPQMIEEVMLLIDYVDFLQKDNDDEQLQDRIENIESLKSSTRKFKTVDTFLEHVDIMNSKTEDKDDLKGKVKLMSMHKSKGLEFPVVFISGICFGQLPFYRERFADSLDLEEERRLMYVGMTRAEDVLYMSSIERYRGEFVDVSPFIEDSLTHDRDMQQ